MPTTDTDISRLTLTHPDLGHDGGALLHSKIASLLTKVGDNMGARYGEATSIADSTTVELDHGFGANLNELSVLIYSGTGDTKTLIADAADAGWVIAEKVGDERTIIEITTPGSGGPHDFSVIVLDGQVPPHFSSQLLASAPATPPTGSMVLWSDDNKRYLSKDDAGAVNTFSDLRIAHVSTSFNALPGFHYIVDTSGGVVTATLPATIQDYDVIQFSDATKSFNVNNLTIARNGNNIDGLAADLVISTPGDGAVLVGDNTNSNWVKASSGAAAGGVGEAGINYVINSNAENDTNDVTATNVTLASESGSPLFGDASFQLTSQGSTGTVDWDLDTIDNAVLDSSLSVLCSAVLKTDNLGADGDWEVLIYNSTDAADVTTPFELLSDQHNYWRDTFVPVSGKTYVVRVRRTITTASHVLLVDSVKVSPDNQIGLVHGFEHTKTVDDTVLNVTGTDGSTVNSISSASAFAFRDSQGDYWLTFQLRAIIFSAGATSHRVTIDGVDFDSATDGNQAIYASVGTGNVALTDAIQTNKFRIGSSASFTEANVGGTVKLSAKPTWWDANVDPGLNVITDSVVKANARAKYTLTTTTAVSAGAAYDFDSEIYNEGGFTDSGAGVITVPAPGKYQVMARVSYTSDAGALHKLELEKNGTVVGAGDTSGGGNEGRSLSLFAEVECAAGDTLEIVHSGGTSPAQVAGEGESSLSISRLADYSAGQAASFAVAKFDVYGLVKRPIAFKVSQDTGQNLPGSLTTVSGLEVAETTDFDDVSGWDTGNDEYTVPVGGGGLWLFQASLSLTNVADGDFATFELQLDTGGGYSSILKSRRQFASATFDKLVSVSWPGLRLADGDKVRLGISNNASMDINGSQPESTYFAGQRLGD